MILINLIVTLILLDFIGHFFLFISFCFPLSDFPSFMMEHFVLAFGYFWPHHFPNDRKSIFIMPNKLIMTTSARARIWAHFCNNNNNDNKSHTMNFRKNFQRHLLTVKATIWILQFSFWKQIGEKLNEKYKIKSAMSFRCYVSPFCYSDNRCTGLFFLLASKCQPQRKTHNDQIEVITLKSFQNGKKNWKKLRLHFCCLILIARKSVNVSIICLGLFIEMATRAPR